MSPDDQHQLCPLPSGDIRPTHRDIDLSKKIEGITIDFLQHRIYTHAVEEAEKAGPPEKHHSDAKG